MILNILIVGILLYLTWALIHHRRDKSLTFTILLEYLLTALLSLILLMGVVF